MKKLYLFLTTLISVSMFFAIVSCAPSSQSPPQVAPTQPAQTPGTLIPPAPTSQPPSTGTQSTPVTTPSSKVIGNLKVIMDGNIDEWSSRAVKISDPCGDVSDKAASKKGADLKMVWILMAEDYLYVAIQLYDAFDPSLLRNYIIDFDFDNDKLPDFDFGVRPYDWPGRTAGKAWILGFGRTGNKSDWFNENNISIFDIAGVASAWKLDAGIIEMAIPRVTATYKMRDSVTSIVRITDGKIDIDSSGTPFSITLNKDR